MAALPVLRALHELLWYLGEARTLRSSETLRSELGSLTGQVEEAAAAPAGQILEVDVEALRSRAAPLLREASRLVRAGYDGDDLSEHDLSGRDLSDRDLRGACLRGARLLGTDLRECDLERADLLGADLRGADVGGAGLAEALFLTQTQLGGTRGDRRTTLPHDLERPSHWSR
jgi:pentapeptide repeat protein